LKKKKQPKSVKPKMAGRKLRNGVNWKEAFMQKNVKITGVKQDLGVLNINMWKGSDTPTE
jgi:hypothetical protein